MSSTPCWSENCSHGRVSPQLRDQINRLSLTLHFYLASHKKLELKLFSCQPHGVFIHMHGTHTYIHTTRMTSNRVCVSSCAQLPVQTTAERLTQKKIYCCTVSLADCEPVCLIEGISHLLWAMQPDRPRWYKNTNTAGPTLHPPSPNLLNTAWLLCVRGAADGRGLRMTRISRNQTPLPLALMLMTMLGDGGGIECHSACICMGTQRRKSQLFSLSAPVR